MKTNNDDLLQNTDDTNKPLTATERLRLKLMSFSKNKDADDVTEKSDTKNTVTTNNASVDKNIVVKETVPSEERKSENKPIENSADKLAQELNSITKTDKETTAINMPLKAVKDSSDISTSNNDQIENDVNNTKPTNTIDDKQETDPVSNIDINDKQNNNPVNNVDITDKQVDKKDSSDISTSNNDQIENDVNNTKPANTIDDKQETDPVSNIDINDKQNNNPVNNVDITDKQVDKIVDDSDNSTQTKLPIKEQPFNNVHPNADNLTTDNSNKITNPVDNNKPISIIPDNDNAAADDDAANNSNVAEKVANRYVTFPKDKPQTLLHEQKDDEEKAKLPVSKPKKITPHTIHLQHESKIEKKHFWSKSKIITLFGTCAVILIAGGWGINQGLNQSSHNNTSSSHVAAKHATSKHAKDVNTQLTAKDTSVSAVKAQLNNTAKATSQPYKVQATSLGGGYTMGVITYYPDDPTKTYMDYSVVAPQTPGSVTNDQTAQDINKKLAASLPTINKTITVKDKSKVSFASYKQNDGTYHTILLYDNKPFGFVTTKADGSMVNNVTTYYIQNVQK